MGDGYAIAIGIFIFIFRANTGFILKNMVFGAEITSASVIAAVPFLCPRAVTAGTIVGKQGARAIGAASQGLAIDHDFGAALRTFIAWQHARIAVEVCNITAVAYAAASTIGHFVMTVFVAKIIGRNTLTANIAGHKPFVANTLAGGFIPMAVGWAGLFG